MKHPSISSPSQTPLLSSALSLEKWYPLFKTAVEKKAFELVLLDVSKLSSLTDFYFICTASSKKHAQTLCNYFEQTLKKHNLPVLAIDGYQAGEWILIDAGAFFIHIFQSQAREHYQLETLWVEAISVALPKNLFLPTGESEPIS